jgi:ATPase subunit of ABC transporter with duplicated ATPase domains
MHAICPREGCEQGLVGVNGSGKSTLLHAIANQGVARVAVVVAT